MTENTPEDKNDFAYWAFISYAHRDAEFCGWLHKKLDGYKTPSSLVGETANDGIHTVPAKLYPIFRDREELPAGANLSDAITAALRDARYLVVICSSNSAQSFWVNQEIAYFISLGREKYILPIILEGEPNSTDPQKPECFPPALRTPKEPLAADARKGKDGRDAAVMKLRAGLLGVGLEDLINRELKRQKKQMMVYALVAVLMLFLAVFSWVKQQEADEAKNLAFIAEKNAEHNYGLSLAEKADRAFSEHNVNEGQIYSAHALARIDRKRDKDAEITYLSTFGNRFEKTGIIVKTIKLKENDDRFVKELLSQDGKIFASVNEKDKNRKIIRLFYVDTQKELPPLQGHDDPVLSLSFSPNHKLLASGQYNGIIRLWNIYSGKQLLELKGHKDRIWTMTFSPDGKMLASGGKDKTVRLWNLDTGKQLAQFNHENWVRSVAFSTDGKILASGGEDKTIRLWNTTTHEQQAILKGHEGSVFGLSFASNENILASGGMDATVRLWDTITGKQFALFTGHEELSESVHFSPDGKILASGSWDTKVRLWNVATGQLLAQLAGDGNPVRNVRFFPNGNILASGGMKTIRLWDLTKSKLLLQIPKLTEHVQNVSFSPDGRMQALVDKTDKKIIRLFDATTGKLISALQGNEKAVTNLSFSPDGKMLASGGWDKTIRLWNVTTGTQIAKIIGHDDGINDLSFSPDGKILASGGWDKTIRLWDITTGKQLAQIKHGWVQRVSFSPDGKMLISQDEKKNIKQYSLDDLSVRDWKAQAAKDEKQYGLKLEGMKLVPIGVEP